MSKRCGHIAIRSLYKQNRLNCNCASSIFCCPSQGIINKYMITTLVTAYPKYNCEIIHSSQSLSKAAYTKAFTNNGNEVLQIMEFVKVDYWNMKGMILHTLNTIYIATLQQSRKQLTNVHFPCVKVQLHKMQLLPPFPITRFLRLGIVVLYVIYGLWHSFDLRCQNVTQLPYSGFLQRLKFPTKYQLFRGKQLIATQILAIEVAR